MGNSCSLSITTDGGPTRVDAVKSGWMSFRRSAASIFSTTTYLLLAAPASILAKRARMSLIPNPIDQYPCAHSRSPMDMMRQG